MQWWQIVLLVLLFAVITAVLYGWGLKKSMNQQQVLMQKLYQRSSDLVRKQLKKQEQITEKEVQKLVESVTASEFHSKNRAVVADPKTFSKTLLQKMLQRGFLEQVDAHTYRATK